MDPRVLHTSVDRRRPAVSAATLAGMSRRAMCLAIATAAAAVVAAALLASRDGSDPRAQTGPVPARPAPPTPRQPIPREPAALARTLTQNTEAAYAAIDAWGKRGRTPPEVLLRSLYHQRIHILLSERPKLARAVIRRLPRALASQARELVGARRALASLAPPTRRRRFRTGPALPADVLLGHYRRAERRFRVNRRVLAAVNLVETGFNRLRSLSTAGARGPMQFIPSTWRAYGMGGDIDDPRDAIMGAANYLRASGAPGQLRRALFAYNHSDRYVEAVLRYARQMRADSRAYYLLHSWQIFVRTPSGLRRLTGPRPR
jgi:membrane-bound lytic murein transglycosylase B